MKYFHNSSDIMNENNMGSYLKERSNFVVYVALDDTSRVLDFTPIKGMQ